MCFKTKIKVETTLVATGSPILPLLDTPPLFADNEICQRRGLLEKLEKPFPSGIKVWSNFLLVQKRLIEKLEIPVCFPSPINQLAKI